MQTIWKVSLATTMAIGVAACSDTKQITEPLAPDQSEVSNQSGGGGAVYTSTNSPEANEVLVFPRAANGSLGAPVAFATGGLGTGGGLGNQDAVVLTSDTRRLLVVNAGSNEVSVFGVDDKGLKLLDRVSSGGATPVSIAVRRRLVYVLNAGGTGNITGFRLDTKGKLLPIPNSTRPLSSPAAGAAQVSFSPVANVLVVTEKATNVISTYRIVDGGLTVGPNVQPSVGATPFGFAFRKNGTLVVSEAFGGAPDASALSSYNVSSMGTLSVISPSVGTTETAACWVVITSNGRFVYTSNTGSNTISGYRLSPSGELRLLDADGVTATTMAAPIDLALTRSSRYLYSLDSGSGAISAFSVEIDGSLTPISGAAGLPAGANGLAAL
ncbi:MAG: lactonase family protein [Gemmatimonadaceae bacterium]